MVTCQNTAEDFSDLLADLSEISGIEDKVTESYQERNLPPNVIDFFSRTGKTKKIDRRSQKRYNDIEDDLSREFGLNSIESRVEKLADYCFTNETYMLSVNGKFVGKLGMKGETIGISVDISEQEARGKVEFSFDTRFENKLGTTALFIQELGRYIGTDPKITSEDVLKVAYWKTPYMTGKDRGKYKVAFEFEQGKTKVSFSKDDKDTNMVNREYLDQGSFNFKLAKANKDYSHIVFERYTDARNNTLVAKDKIPSYVKGPDGIIDDVYETPGCLEHYVDISGCILE